MITIGGFEHLHFLLRTLKWKNKGRERVENKTERPGKRRLQKGTVSY